MTDVILASGSPRRQKLLAALLDTFTICPSDVPEPLSGDAPADAVALAMAKAAAVAATAPQSVVIGADTIVFDELRSYGKPADAVDATAMLARLHGRSHSVATGIAVIQASHRARDLSVSRVTLHLLRHDEILAYVASGRPLDKAGAYAIQDEDIPTVDALEGCYCGVMGLPLWRLRRLLLQVGIECRLPDETFSRCTDCPERKSCSDAISDM